MDGNPNADRTRAAPTIGPRWEVRVGIVAILFLRTSPPVLPREFVVFPVVLVLMGAIRMVMGAIARRRAFVAR